MGISMFNPEGYSDPTAYEAIRNLEKQKWRSLVYICSPYSGDVEGNTLKARRFSRFAVDQGAIPLAPHLFFPQFVSEEAERDLVLFMDLVLLGRCEQLWVFGSEVTSGMAAEIARAKRKGMAIRYFTEEYVETDEEDE